MNKHKVTFVQVLNHDVNQVQLCDGHCIKYHFSEKGKQNNHSHHSLWYQSKRIE